MVSYMCSESRSSFALISSYLKKNSFMLLVTVTYDVGKIS